MAVVGAKRQARQHAERVRLGLPNARAATTEQLLDSLVPFPPRESVEALLHPDYRHLLIPLGEDPYEDDRLHAQIRVCHAMLACVDKRVRDNELMRVYAEHFESLPRATPAEVWSEEEDAKFPPAGTWEDACRRRDQALRSLDRRVG
jgi:hypothetical protein